jgi:hypothetical protein
MSWILQYWEFMNRPPPLKRTPGIEVLPHLVRDTMIFTAMFSVFFIFVPAITRKLWPTWYKTLPKRKRLELPSYVVCLVHHFYAVPLAWRHIFNDAHLAGDAVLAIDYAPITSTIAPWCIAYLISDTLFFALLEALRGKFEYIVHHLLTLLLVVSSLFGPGSILRFIPHLLICDTTNIFFNIAWLMRLTGLKGSPMVTIFEILFALTFLFVRVINMPVTFYAIGAQASNLGIGKYALAPIAFLQWYWFYKIVCTLFSRMSTGSTPSGEVKNE